MSEISVSSHATTMPAAASSDLRASRRSHVAGLLEQAAGHAEHLRNPVADVTDSRQ
jgi:hypothetical protein